MADSSLPEANLQEWVRQAQNGDTDAFARLYDHFFPAIYRYAAFRLPKEAAEDVTADIFVKAWEKLHTYRSHRSVPFGAWLFRIARHTVIDAYRTRHDTEEMDDTFIDPDVFNRADTHAHRQDLLRIVRSAMDKLPRRYREILLLTFVSELPHHEVARILRLTEGAVRILKLRALRKLERLLPTDIRFDT